MAKILISSVEGGRSGVYLADFPVVVVRDDPNAPHRVIFQTEQLLAEFNQAAYKFGSGFSDCKHVLKPDSVPAYSLNKPDEKLLKIEGQLILMPYLAKNRLLTGSMQSAMYEYLIDHLKNL